MNSEDIARYVAELEAQVVDAANFGTREQNARIEAELEVQRLRAAPQLPDVTAYRADDGMWGINGYWFGADERDYAVKQAAVWLDAVRQIDAEAAAQEATPDTSRVSFGARHEGTGMVLLQHADLPGTWGVDVLQSAPWHRKAASLPVNRAAAHAALAEVREALNTAEAAGVDIEPHSALCGWFGPFHGDDPALPADSRAHSYLAREVQALVDQGLRGDDLNARLPYEVRDHRVQEVPAGEVVYGDDGMAYINITGAPVALPEGVQDVSPQQTLAKDLYDVGLTTVGPDDLDNQQLAERLLALGWSRARREGGA